MSEFSLEFGTLYYSILRVVADFLQGRGKISHCFKSSTSFVLQQCQNKEVSKKGF